MSQASHTFFVVCTGRCGTSTLVRMLRMHPAVCALNAPRPHLSVEAYAKWATPRHKDKIENKIRRKRTNLIAQIISNNYIYVEASNYTANLIEELHRMFNAKFIHLYCSGKDFVSRGLDKDWYREQPFKYRLQAWVRRKFITDIGRTKFDHQLPPPEGLKTRIEKITWLWAEINRIIVRHLSYIPDEQKFSLRLEDLGKNRLIDLHKFLGIEVIPEVLDSMTALLEKTIRESKEPVVHPSASWSDDESQKFKAIAGEMMQVLGYDVEDIKETNGA